jgi:pilus assembly protein Flp/PilA
MMARFPQFENEEGQGMAEYALILALIAVLLIGGLTALKTGIGDSLQDVVDGLAGTGS